MQEDLPPSTVCTSVLRASLNPFRGYGGGNGTTARTLTATDKPFKAKATSRSSQSLIWAFHSILINYLCGGL